MFIDFAGGVGCLNVGHSHPAASCGGAGATRAVQRTPTTRSFPTRSTRSCPSGCSHSLRSAGRCKAAFFNAGTEAVENAVKFARAYHRPAGGDRLRGRVPRADDAVALADVEDASVQGGARPVRARGLPRAVPERVSRAVGGRGAGGACVARSRRLSPRRTSLRSSSSRYRAKAGSFPPHAEFIAACARSATSTGSFSSATRCRADSPAPAASSPSSTSASSRT